MVGHRPGHASALSDGASAMLVMSESKAKELGLPIRARIRSMAVTVMQLDVDGPVPATQKALKRAVLSIEDMGMIEFNKAFARASAAHAPKIGLLDVMEEKVNLNGRGSVTWSSIELSGSRISTTFIDLMEEANDVAIGLATMCIGLGQGIAASSSASMTRLF